MANKRSAVEPPIQKSQWQTSEAQLSHRSRKARGAKHPFYRAAQLHCRSLAAMLGSIAEIVRIFARVRKAHFSRAAPPEEYRGVRMSTDEYGEVRMSTEGYGEKKLQTTPHPCPISPRCPQCPISPPQNKIPPPCAAALRLQPVANKRSAVEPPIQESLWQTSEAQLSHRSRKACGKQAKRS